MSEARLAAGFEAAGFLKRAEALGGFGTVLHKGDETHGTILLSLLERGAQTHQARLTAHVSLYDPDVWDRYHALADVFAARGADVATAQQQAWARLYEIVQREALALSFLDNFWRLVWIFAAVVPFVLFLGRRPHPGRPPADAERPPTVVEA